MNYYATKISPSSHSNDNVHSLSTRMILTMNSLNLSTLYFCFGALVWLIHEMITLNAIPITNLAIVEKKFLRHRTKLLRKVFRVGSKYYIKFLLCFKALRPIPDIIRAFYMYLQQK
jgi:hypothetical protein